MAKSISIIFSGFGGQGVLTLGQFIAFSALEQNKKVTWMPSYGAEMRGGTANCSVIVSDKLIGSPLISKADIIVAMNKPSLIKFESKVKEGGKLIVNSSIVDPKLVKRKDIEVISVPASTIATEIGDLKVANMVVCGVIMKVEPEILTMDVAKKIMKDKFTGKKSKFIPLNEKAILEGMKI